MPLPLVFTVVMTFTSPSFMADVVVGDGDHTLRTGFGLAVLTVVFFVICEEFFNKFVLILHFFTDTTLQK